MKYTATPTSAVQQHLKAGSYVLKPKVVQYKNLFRN